MKIGNRELKDGEMNHRQEALNFGRVWKGCSFACLVLIIMFFLNIQIVSASPGWFNSSWIYRQPITVTNNNATVNLTEYQVLVNLTSSNVGSNWNWANNGSDIRFTNSSDISIPFWIESWNSTSQTATIWAKVPYVAPGGTETLYMYYGNPSASSASNGTNTFEFFDDFEDGNYTDKWTVLGGNWSEASGILTGTDISKIRITNALSVSDFQLSLKIRSELDYYPALDYRTDSDLTPTDEIVVYARAGQQTFSFWDQCAHNGNFGTANLNTWYRLEMTVLGSAHNWVFYTDGTSAGSSSTICTTVTGNYLGFRTTTSGSGKYDDIRIRKYASPEPTYSISAQETFLIITLQDSSGNPVASVNVTVYESGTSTIACQNITNSLGKISCTPDASKSYDISVPSMNKNITNVNVPFLITIRPEQKIAPEVQTTLLSLSGTVKYLNNSLVNSGSFQISIYDSANQSIWGPYSFNNAVSRGTFGITVGGTNILRLILGSRYKINLEFCDLSAFNATAGNCVSGTSHYDLFTTYFMG